MTRLTLALALLGCGSSSTPATAPAPLANAAVITHEPASSKEHARAMEEGKMFLDILAKNAKVHYVTQGAFPIGSAPLTPATDCCTEGKDTDRRCKPNIAYWRSPWVDLDFAVEQHHHFQYSYTSTDGTSFVATAVGDLDCDGRTITYKLEGTSPDGNPRVVLTQPSAADD